MNEPCGKSTFLGVHIWDVAKETKLGIPSYTVKCKFCDLNAPPDDFSKSVYQFEFNKRASQLANAIRRDSQIDASNSKARS